MSSVDFAAIRTALSKLPSDHDASGSHRPTVDEIFTPKHHANALDPSTPIVVGARGTGKSFWAGVLQHDDTREIAARSYPALGLDKILVEAGYTGIDMESGGITARVIDARIPRGEEDTSGFLLWQSVILRAARFAMGGRQREQLKTVMGTFADPEDAADEFHRLDNALAAADKTLLVTFDAVDTLSRDWQRGRLLLDSLFEAVWSLRAYRRIRAKVFVRPEQLNDETLRFIELPKLRSGSVKLEWNQTDLYGLLFFRLLETTKGHVREQFEEMCEEVGASVPSNSLQIRRKWALILDIDAQKELMTSLAGPYMGRSYKNGGTYDWPYKHLGDAKGDVTPRSFLKLFVEAAAFSDQLVSDRVILPDGIRHGLREASRVRVDQLSLEYPWIMRALAPLAGLTVPCPAETIHERWKDTNTVKVIMDAAASPETGFLPPFPPRARNPHEQLVVAMEQIGVLSSRVDGRVDMPDLFRVAALMLKRGQTTPLQRR
ncbi:hypothetical protein [Caballeronia sp. ATUFL_M1_KS5A]|uniref:hypothetical protein n=1 Tax=Caballeronia sp. ATUFL_M1_KS5A TaxID=2921778 RepID=UPI0020285B3D|nr:hypothetical protein [Caballeronia sp. ATUFL_M1_KS5A]